MVYIHTRPKVKVKITNAPFHAVHRIVRYIFVWDKNLRKKYSKNWKEKNGVEDESKILLVNSIQRKEDKRRLCIKIGLRKFFCWNLLKATKNKRRWILTVFWLYTNEWMHQRGVSLALFTYTFYDIKKNYFVRLEFFSSRMYALFLSSSFYDSLKNLYLPAKIQVWFSLETTKNLQNFSH